MHNHQATVPRQLDQLELKRLLRLALIGISVVLLAGFAPVDTLHSIAHDTRHLMGLPCH